MVRNQRGEFNWLYHPFAGEKQFAFGKEVRRGVGLEGIALLDLAAAARDMHLGLADFDVGELGGSLYQDRIIGNAGIAGGEAIGDDRRGRVSELFVIFVSDVFNDSRHD